MWPQGPGGGGEFERPPHAPGWPISGSASALQHPFSKLGHQRWWVTSAARRLGMHSQVVVVVVVVVVAVVLVVVAVAAMAAVAGGQWLWA